VLSPRFRYKISHNHYYTLFFGLHNTIFSWNRQALQKKLASCTKNFGKTIAIYILKWYNTNILEGIQQHVIFYRVAGSGAIPYQLQLIENRKTWYQLQLVPGEPQNKTSAYHNTKFYFMEDFYYGMQNRFSQERISWLHIFSKRKQTRQVGKRS